MSNDDLVHFPMEEHATWTATDGADVPVVLRELHLLRSQTGLSLLEADIDVDGRARRLRLAGDCLADAPVNAVRLKRALTGHGPLTDLRHWTDAPAT